ncbi:MAG: efflux RND transporter periplasmic adaptor subunit [Candidatus Aminicenantes bacterium]|nr:efflux RND transporter periplasmic adaptor subunit [Candidatus Aminicenantes bacterium]
MKQYRVKVEKMSKKKLFIVIAVVVFIAVIIYFNLQSQREKSIKVMVEAVKTQDLTAKISASGEIKPKKDVIISAQRSGKVLKIDVEEGQVVYAGDFLLKLESTQYEANAERDRAFIRSLRAELIKAEARLRKDKNVYNRQKSLFEKELLSQNELEAAQAEYDMSFAGKQAITFQIRQAEASLKSTLDNLEKTVYYSPIDGIVTSLQVEEGETAMMGTMNIPGTELMTIADLSVMEAEVEVDETDVIGVEIGQLAEVLVDAFPDTVIYGKVTEIGSSALQQSTGSEESKDFKVVITLEDPPGNLKPGLSASADIIIAEREDVVAIPISALVLKEEEGDDRNERKPKEGLYLVQADNRVKFVPVEKGIMGELMIEITTGIDVGQTIVVGPYSALRQLKDDLLIKPEKKDEKD